MALEMTSANRSGAQLGPRLPRAAMKAFFVATGVVLAWPYAGHATLLAVTIWFLRRWARVFRHRQSMPRLERMRRHRMQRQDAALDRCYEAMLAKKGLKDSPENRAMIRWNR